MPAVLQAFLNKFPKFFHQNETSYKQGFTMKLREYGEDGAVWW